MYDGRDVIYIYDGTFDGFLSVVFESFYSRRLPEEIAADGSGFQHMLFCDVKYIDTDYEKARRVYNSISKKISPRALYNVFRVFLSALGSKERVILDYLRCGYKIGANIDNYLTLDAVRIVNDTAKSVSNEAGNYREFLRFSELKNGALYAEMSPKNNVLPMITAHYADRFTNIVWLIHDLTYGQCAAYNCRECEIRYVTTPPKLEYSENEQKYRRLWRVFYDAVEIKERHNEKCRMTCMPKRYWRHLTEFQRLGD